MKTKIEQDAFFIQAVKILADKYDAKVEIDIENRIVNFPDENTQLQLIEEIEKLFGNYIY